MLQLYGEFKWKGGIGLLCSDFRCGNLKVVFSILVREGFPFFIATNG